MGHSTWLLQLALRHLLPRRRWTLKVYILCEDIYDEGFIILDVFDSEEKAEEEERERIRLDKEARFRRFPTLFIEEYEVK